jgi:hypothetical protein
VWISAALDPSIESQLRPYAGNTKAQIELEQFAARASSVNLGEGDDQLWLSGDVLDTSIDLGTGTNRLIFDGGVQNTEIAMGNDSINQIILGNENNSITLHGGDRLDLKGGTGEDQIFLSKVAATGLIDGGSGANTIVIAGNPNGSGTLMTIEGPNQGKLDGLKFLNIGSIQLSPGDDNVMVTSGGWLTGQLLGGAGVDTLDFSACLNQVNLTLDSGTISEPYNLKNGNIDGFERILGGIGDDQFIFSSRTNNVGKGTSMEIWGGPGIDQFLWNSQVTSWPNGIDNSNGLPSLSDLQVIAKTDGGIGLSDQVGWANNNNEDSRIAHGSVQILTPSTIDGLGDCQLLPIAPIDQILSGQLNLGTHAVNQLAIGTTAIGGELLALGPQGQHEVIAHLPGLFSGYCGSIP